MYSAIVAFRWAPLLIPSHRPPVSYGLFSVKMDTSLFLMAVCDGIRSSAAPSCRCRGQTAGRRGKKKMDSDWQGRGSSVCAGRVLGRSARPGGCLIRVHANQRCGAVQRDEKAAVMTEGRTLLLGYLDLEPPAAAPTVMIFQSTFHHLAGEVISESPPHTHTPRTPFLPFAVSSGTLEVPAAQTKCHPATCPPLHPPTPPAFSI